MYNLNVCILFFIHPLSLYPMEVVGKHFPPERPKFFIITFCRYQVICYLLDLDNKMTLKKVKKKFTFGCRWIQKYGMAPLESLFFVGSGVR